MEEFNVTRFAECARASVRTENGVRPVLTHEPLACVLADYCQEKGIDQAQLLRELSIDPQHPLSQESFRRLAMVTVNIAALARILSAGNTVLLPAGDGA